MSKKQRDVAAVESPHVVYRHGAALLFGLHERFSLDALQDMLDECVAATGETGVGEQLKELWLTHNVIDVSKEQTAAIARTSRPEVQARIELIVRGFLCAPREVKVEKPATTVKKLRRCPACWGEHGGKAGKRKWQRQVNGPIVRRCYACDRCPCEWVLEERTDEEDDVEYVVTKLVEVRNNGD